MGVRIFPSSRRGDKPQTTIAMLCLVRAWRQAALARCVEETRGELTANAFFLRRSTWRGETSIGNRSAAQHSPQWIFDHFAGGTVTTGETPLQDLKSSSEALSSFLRKATMVQIGRAREGRWARSSACRSS